MGFWEEFIFPESKERFLFGKSDNDGRAGGTNGNVNGAMVGARFGTNETVGNHILKGTLDMTGMKSPMNRPTTIPIQSVTGILAHNGENVIGTSQTMTDMSVRVGHDCFPEKGLVVAVAKQIRGAFLRFRRNRNKLGTILRDKMIPVHLRIRTTENLRILRLVLPKIDMTPGEEHFDLLANTILLRISAQIQRLASLNSTQSNLLSQSRIELIPTKILIVRIPTNRNPHLPRIPIRNRHHHTNLPILHVPNKLLNLIRTHCFCPKIGENKNRGGIPTNSKNAQSRAVSGRLRSI